MPSPSPIEKTGARLTFGYFDTELQQASIPPSPTTWPTPPLSPVAAESGPIFVSTSLPVMHQGSDLAVVEGQASSTPITPTQTQPPSSAPEDSTMLFFSPTSSPIERSLTTKSLSRPNSPHPLLIPAHPLRGRSSSLNSAISFTGSLDHRSMTRVRSTSSKTPSFRSRRTGAPQAISPSCSIETLNVNTNTDSSSSSDSIRAPSPQEQVVTRPVVRTRSRRDSVAAFLASAPVRSRVIHSPRGENEGPDVVSAIATGTLRPSPSSSSLSVQAAARQYQNPSFSRSNSVRIGAGAKHVKQRSASFLADFDSTRPQFNGDEDQKEENDVATLCSTTLTLDDNDCYDYSNDSYAYDKTTTTTPSATTVTTATTPKTKKLNKMKMWYPSLSMFNFMMKNRRKL